MEGLPLVVGASGTKQRMALVIHYHKNTYRIESCDRSLVAAQSSCNILAQTDCYIHMTYLMELGVVNSQ